MNKNEALEELTQIESRVIELRKIIEASANIYDRVKTVEDAIQILGVSTYAQKQVRAFNDLCIIIKVLNEGWYPNWQDTNEKKYYIWWNMRGGFSLHAVHYNDGTTDVPSALCFKSRELAEYCSKQFKNLYEDLYL
jgi:hypothetical protein